MASKLLGVSTKVANNGRNLIYTCPTGKSSVIFNGTISNTDINYGQITCTLEVERSGVFTNIGKDIFVPYGLSIIIPKIVLGAGNKLHATISVANTVDINLSVVEKDA